MPIIPGISIDITKLLMDGGVTRVIFDPHGVDDTPTITNGHWCLWGRGYYEARKTVNRLFVMANAVGVQGAWKWKPQRGSNTEVFESLKDGFEHFKTVVAKPGIFHRVRYDTFDKVDMSGGGMPIVHVLFDEDPWRMGHDRQFEVSKSKRKPDDLWLQIGYCLAFQALGLEVFKPVDGPPLGPLALAKCDKLTGACMPCMDR